MPVTRNMVPVFKPLIESEEIAASTESLKMGWLGMGSYVGEFERALAKFCEAEDHHVVAVSTGHAALHLALLLADVGPGDEVITPAFNNIADLQAILATGAQPVFCDIKEDSLCVDIDKAEELVGPRTRAVIPMDYATMLCDHDAVAAFAERHGLRVIHDAAHSLGSRYRGRMIGSFSEMCMFSFDPVKIITCIDGGVLIVRTEQQLRNLHEMRLIGMGQPSKTMYGNQRAWTYDVRQLGFRYHMANLHAAIGLAQLAKMPEIIKTRRTTCRRYNERFAGVAGLGVPTTDYEDAAPFLYYVRVTADRRDAFRDHLRERGVDTGIHWQPGHWFRLFRETDRGDLSVTEQVGHEIVTLPLHSFMREHDEESVVKAVLSFFDR